MIANVAPRKASGAEKTYTITCNNQGFSALLSKAEPGILVGFASTEKHGLDIGETFITTSSGVKIPMIMAVIDGVSYPPGRSKFYFVMPAEDVTIS